MPEYIAYYRVSTQRQGISGLGLEAQRAVVLNFLKDQQPIDEFTDIDHGDNDDRPQLMNALALIKKTGATLLVAKLDRLSRSAGFIHTLMDTKVKFLIAEMPNVNELTIGLLALVAQNELKLISERTKAALAEKKKTGWKPGTQTGVKGIKGKVGNLTPEHAALGRKRRREKMERNPNTIRAKAMIKAMLHTEGMTLSRIVAGLNEAGFTTSAGGKFHSMSVSRLIDA